MPTVVSLCVEYTYWIFTRDFSVEREDRRYLGIVGQVDVNGLYYIEYRSWQSASTE